MGHADAIGAIALALLAAAALAGAPAHAGDVAAGAAPSSTVDLKEDSAKWESGYGVKFFQVVGSATNRGGAALGAVLIHTELLDDAGKVVAQTDCWNGAAEGLADLRGDAAKQKLASDKPKPIAPGASDKWRCTFIEEDVPKFSGHRTRVASTLPAP